MSAHVARLSVLVSTLLIASAVLFAIGGAIERSQRHSEASAVPAAAAAHQSGSAETPAQREAESGGHETPAVGEQAAVAGETPHPDTSEKLLGVDLESIGLTVAAVVAAILLAAGCWFVRRRTVWLAAAAFGLVFAAADGRELAHQIAESRPWVAAIAAALIALHLAVAVVAVALLRCSSGVAAPTLAPPAVPGQAPPALPGQAPPAAPTEAG